MKSLILINFFVIPRMSFKNKPPSVVFLLLSSFSASFPSDLYHQPVCRRLTEMLGVFAAWTNKNAFAFGEMSLQFLLFHGLQLLLVDRHLGRIAIDDPVDHGGGGHWNSVADTNGHHRSFLGAVAADLSRFCCSLGSLVHLQANLKSWFEVTVVTSFNLSSYSRFIFSISAAIFALLCCSEENLKNKLNRWLPLSQTPK